MFTLEVKDEAGPAVTALVRVLTSDMVPPLEVNKAVGRTAEQMTKAHIYELANTRHRANVGQNFYKDAADSVKLGEIDEDSASFRIDKAGFAQRLFGGPIKAKNYSHLWIPVAPESEGKTSKDFSDLIPIISPLTNKGVALQGDKVLFALVEEIAPQDPDPTVLPSDEQYQESCAAAVSLLIEEQFATRIDAANEEIQS